MRPEVIIAETDRARGAVVVGHQAENEIESKVAYVYVSR